MRTYVFLGALAVAGCASPETAFPNLADVSQPERATASPAQQAATRREVEESGEAAREAGRMVRAGEELTRPLPPQP